jgi:DNA-binding transcriptional ArsR family regulator
MDKLTPAYAAVAGYFAMLAEPARLKIMHAICERERTVNQIVDDTGIAQSNVSRHLGFMYRYGVVERRREGNKVYYRVCDETMPELCRAVSASIARKIDGRRPLRRQLLRLAPATTQRA